MEETERLAEALERVTTLERSIRAAQAEQLAWVHELRVLMGEVESHPSRSDRDNREWADRSCTAELATALRVHERTASRILREATALTVELPPAQAALATGEVSLQHVRDLIDTAGIVPADRLPEFEQEARSIAPVTGSVRMGRNDGACAVSRRAVSSSIGPYPSRIAG